MKKITPIIYTNEFGQRVIIKRTLFENEIAIKEKLLLLAKFLNHYNISKNKLLKLNNASCFFKVYNYGFKICLEGRLLQNENTNSFLASYQTKKTIKLFTDIYKKGFEKNSPLLETLKKEILVEFEDRDKDSLSNLLSLLQMPYSKVNLEKDKILNTSMSDIFSILSSLLKQDKNDYLFIEKKKIDLERIDKEHFFIDNIDNVPLDYTPVDTVIYNSLFLNETMIETYSFNSINDYSSLYKVMASLKAISISIEQALSSLYIKCHSSINIISKNKAFISYKFENDSLYKNNNRILSITSTISSSTLTSNLDEAIRNIKLSQISLNSDLSLAIKRALLLKDIQILDLEMFDDININKDEVISTLNEVNKLNTFLAMKGKVNND